MNKPITQFFDDKIMEEFNDDLLQEYLDGTLDQATQEAVEAYVAGSPAAQARLAELQALFHSLDTLTDLPLATDLSADVVAHIRRETAVAQPLPRWLWGLLLGQAVIALLLLSDLWAALLGGFANGRQLALAWFGNLQLSVEALVFRFWTSLTALLQGPSLPTLAIDLPTGQWAILFGLALLVWLAGNRLLFGNE